MLRRSKAIFGLVLLLGSICGLILAGAAMAEPTVSATGAAGPFTATPVTVTAGTANVMFFKFAANEAFSGTVAMSIPAGWRRPTLKEDWSKRGDCLSPHPAVIEGPETGPWTVGMFVNCKPGQFFEAVYGARGKTVSAATKAGPYPFDAVATSGTVQQAIATDLVTVAPSALYRFDLSAHFLKRDPEGATYAEEPEEENEAGGEWKLTPTALDRFGNVVTSFECCVSFTSSDPYAVLPVETGGVASFFQEGKPTVEVTDIFNTAIRGSTTVEVESRPFTKRVGVLDPYHTQARLTPILTPGGFGGHYNSPNGTPSSSGGEEAFLSRTEEGVHFPSENACPHSEEWEVCWANSFTAPRPTPRPFLAGLDGPDSNNASDEGVYSTLQPYIGESGPYESKGAGPIGLPRLGTLVPVPTSSRWEWDLGSVCPPAARCPLANKRLLYRYVMWFGATCGGVPFSCEKLAKPVESRRLLWLEVQSPAWSPYQAPGAQLTENGALVLPAEAVLHPPPPSPGMGTPVSVNIQLQPQPVSIEGTVTAGSNILKATTGINELKRGMFLQGNFILPGTVLVEPTGGPGEWVISPDPIESASEPMTASGEAEVVKTERTARAGDQHNVLSGVGTITTSTNQTYQAMVAVNMTSVLGAATPQEQSEEACEATDKFWFTTPLSQLFTASETENFKPVCTQNTETGFVAVKLKLKNTTPTLASSSTMLATQVDEPFRGNGPAKYWECVSNLDVGSSVNREAMQSCEEIVGDPWEQEEGKEPPIVKEVAPSHGPSAGGQTIKVYGWRFVVGEGTRFTFGGVSVGSDCPPETTGADHNGVPYCYVTPPPHAPGTVDVTATVEGETSAVTPEASYTYE